MGRMKRRRTLLMLLICAALCAGCGQGEKEKQEKEDAQAGTQKEEQNDAVKSGTDEEPLTDNEIIAEAMEKTSKLASFHAATKGSLKLGGKTINGEFGMTSDIRVVQGADRENLQMAMETKISPGNAVSTAYYKDGWYYSDDGKRKDKQEKPPEEVLGTVTDITDMVIGASDEIENVSAEESGTDRVYSYELPPYIAEDYIAKLMTEMGAEDTLLDHASVEVESLKLVSTVDENGILTRQKISAVGKLKKAIVSVPVKAKLTAEFAETDEAELEMKLW